MPERSPGRRPVIKDSALAARNREIVDLRRQGLTLAEIGERFALTRQRVAQIIDAAGRPPIAEVLAARHGRAAGGAEMRSGGILERWRAALAPAQSASRLELPGRAFGDLIERRGSAADRAARGREKVASSEGSGSEAAPMVRACEHGEQGIAERRARVRELLEEGLSPSEIAVQLDTQLYAVYGDLARLRVVDGRRRSRG